jgi:hypothetical protein
MLERKMSVFGAFKVLVLSWVGNFVGCLFVAWLLHYTELFDHHDLTLIHTAESKLIGLSWKVIFVRAIFGNMMVGIATWLQTAALDMPGKILAIFLPIFTFAAMGFEHCIANQFIISMGCMQHADGCSAQHFMIDNLLPATIGNWLGGTLFVALPFAIAFSDQEVFVQFRNLGRNLPMPEHHPDHHQEQEHEHGKEYDTGGASGGAKVGYVPMAPAGGVGGGGGGGRLAGLALVESDHTAGGGNSSSSSNSDGDGGGGGGEVEMGNRH